MEPDFFNPCDDDSCACGEDHDDYERDHDFLLEQQEMEDFEQADEYFDHWGGSADYDY